MANQKINISNKTVAYNGAVIGVVAVFIYSIIVMIYAIIRSSITIYNIMPNGERSNILLANGFAIAYSVTVFSLIMALFSSIAGAIASVVLKKSIVYFNPQFYFNKALIVSTIAALVMLIILYALLYSFLKDWMTFNYIETFSFWFLIPAAIFLTVCIVGGNKLNKALDTRITENMFKKNIQILATKK